MNGKLTLILVALALPGVIATSWLALPVLLESGSTPPVPLKTLQGATAIQGVVFVLLSAQLGSVLGQKVGLSSPTIWAILSRGRIAEAVRPQIWPGFVGGVLGAAILLGFYLFSPPELAEAQGAASIPLVVRVLYGGITEEVLIRWGLMTLLAWVGWRIVQRGQGKPSGWIMGASIVISALLFGISHVPAAIAAMTVVPVSVMVYITVGNAMFGIVAGYLFWRYGLEAAIVAHILAHLFAFGIRG
ncbi:CPBP family intramembrane glutamic endopeptidase [Lyngbya confervoides]|uniref:CPBP family intramembrane metalloprotease n=1 Tax=Lyngbya confervoides BDU141951 TaxID=1574623 RepID=A0ABD4SYY6_9CYAN|nr:CPBP family intramembrane glutamic endopeptidase [Lyngbya confervoides]MCM1981560.1 CPBP family intramembrane metalloprotease [Lyngbya confervoides BDU141951]